MNNEPTQPIRVLLVEDDHDCGGAMKTMLEKRGMNVVWVESVEQVSATFSESAFDVVVSDIRLDGIGDARGGIEVLRRVRQISPEFPVILITGYESIATASDAVRLKAHDYLVKPLDAIEDLLAPIRQAVAHYRVLRENERLAARLRESERMLETVLSSINDLVFVFDEEQRFVMFRSDGRSPLFAAPREFLGKKHSEVMPPHVDALFAAAFAKVRQGEVSEFEYALTVGDKTLYGAAKLSPIRENGRFAGAVAVVRDVTERKKTERALLGYQKHIRKLALDLSLAEEEQRRRIALELHEGLALDLCRCKSTLHDLLASETDAQPGLKARLESILDLLARALNQARTLTHDLFPPALHIVGLAGAIEDLADRTARQWGFHAHVEIDEPYANLDKNDRIVIYRAAAELLENVGKHSRARHAWIRIRNANDCLIVEVEDDGKGFDPVSAEANGIGLLGIRERIGSLGGKLDIVSGIGKGTAISVSLPLRQGGDRHD